MKHRLLYGEEVELLDRLSENQGYYDACDVTGKRVGKLAGYAGTYDTPDGPRQYVGDRYWNVPRGAERDPLVMDAFVQRLVSLIRDGRKCELNKRLEIDCAFGCPEGGVIPAFEIARYMGYQFSRADKKVIALATETEREKTKLILGRHTVEPGWKVALIEELINNLSTADKAIKLVEDAGATVVAIFCLINRSPEGVMEYDYEGRKIPITQAVLIPTPEYRQDDPYVAGDIAAGRIVRKPKDHWDELIS